MPENLFVLLNISDVPQIVTQNIKILKNSNLQVINTALENRKHGKVPAGPENQEDGADTAVFLLQ